MSSPASEVRFGRLERRSLLLNLTATQILLLGAGLGVMVGSSMTHGLAGTMVSAPAWLALTGCGLLHAGGRPLVEVLPTATGWAWRRLTRTHRELNSPVPVGQVAPLKLPGVAGQVRLSAAGRSGVAVVRIGRDGSRGAVTVVAEVRGRGFLLEEPGVQDRRISAWGRLLASFGEMPDVAAVQVVHRSAPSATTGIREWWVAQHTGSPWTDALVDDLVANAETGTRLQILLAIRMRTRGGEDIDAVLSRFHDAIDGTELDFVDWLTPRQLHGIIRHAYDPSARLVPAAVTAGTCEPMGVDEAWGYARSDSAFHVTYWVSEWPRTCTHASFLRPLLLAPGAHRTLSLIACPLSPGKALREIRRDRAEQMADAAARVRIGRVEDEAHRAAAAELIRREEQLTSGHGDLRFTGLLTVSTASLDELGEACAVTEAAAARAGCELRRLVGQQVQAYAAAALPLARRLW